MNTVGRDDVIVPLLSNSIGLYATL